MSGLLDTSMLVRYLTGDPPELAERPARVIDREDGLLFSDVLFAESKRVSFAEALIWAAARSTATKAVYSLDERFPEKGIVLDELPNRVERSGRKSMIKTTAGQVGMKSDKQA